MANLDSSDPVTCGLRASARQLAGVAVFSGVVNLLTLSGSLYMLQVYDRVVGHHGVSTLKGLVIGMAVLLVFDFVLRQTRARTSRPGKGMPTKSGVPSGRASRIKGRLKKSFSG